MSVITLKIGSVLTSSCGTHAVAGWDADGTPYVVFLKGVTPLSDFEGIQLEILKPLFDPAIKQYRPRPSDN